MSDILPLRTRSLGVIALVATGLSACSSATDAGARAGSLSLSVTTKQQPAASADIVIGVGASPLVVTKAQIVVRKIELMSANASATCTDSDDDGCAEVEVGPALVDLPLDASVKTDLAANVPAGNYTGVEVKIGPVRSGNSRSQAFIAAHPDFAGLGVRVEGTYEGRQFTFTSDVDAAIEANFGSSVAVGGADGISNLTIAIDVASWFRSGSTTMDPSNSANKARINSNIAASFRAFSDDDHDGFDDRRH